MSTYIGKLQIGPSGDQIPIGSTLFGNCATAAAQAAKVVTLNDFDKELQGVTVFVRFDNGNTVISGVTLSIGGTVAYPVTGNCFCMANTVMGFTLDIVDSTHTYWRCLGNAANIGINTPSAIDATAAVGTSASYAREDHVHNIVVAEGDNNGQVKIAGQNVNVHGLGDAAYTDADAYATAAQGTLAENAMPKSGGTFTGPVILNGAPTSNLEAATKAYVDSEISNVLTGSADAMIFKGTLGASTATPVPTITSVPTNSYGIGDTYRIVTAGTYAGVNCELGDLIIAIHQGPATGTTVIDDDWVVAQGNIDGAVIGPASSTATHIARFKDNTGKEIEDSGYTIETSVPSGAVFTDTTYSLTDGEAYTEYTLIDSSNSPIANSVDNNGASILASVNQGVLTLAAGIQFITGDVGASLAPSAI